MLLSPRLQERQLQLHPDHFGALLPLMWVAKPPMAIWEWTSACSGHQLGGLPVQITLAYLFHWFMKCRCLTLHNHMDSEEMLSTLFHWHFQWKHKKVKTNYLDLKRKMKQNLHLFELLVTKVMPQYNRSLWDFCPPTNNIHADILYKICSWCRHPSPPLPSVRLTQCRAQGGHVGSACHQ